MKQISSIILFTCGLAVMQRLSGHGESFSDILGNILHIAIDHALGPA